MSLVHYFYVLVECWTLFITNISTVFRKIVQMTIKKMHLLIDTKLPIVLYQLINQVSVVVCFSIPKEILNHWFERCPISAVSRELLEPEYWFRHQKIKQYSTQTFLFHQRNYKLIYSVWNFWKLGILNAYLWIKYSMAKEKPGDFMKKHATAT